MDDAEICALHGAARYIAVTRFTVTTRVQRRMQCATEHAGTDTRATRKAETNSSAEKNVPRSQKARGTGIGADIETFLIASNELRDAPRGLTCMRSRSVRGGVQGTKSTQSAASGSSLSTRVQPPDRSHH